jgi:succinate dehydrogenase flavin-adding protein (antitoxin of CptAB toxin-antitoxin module)
MLMGNKKKFHFLKTNNLDRVSQCQMYSHKEFKKMIIFHCQRGKREAATFLENFKNSLKDFGMSDINLNNVCRQVEIKDDKSDEEWISESKKHLKPDVELAVYIINGNKTGNKTYKTIK